MLFILDFERLHEDGTIWGYMEIEDGIYNTDFINKKKILYC